MGSGFVDLSLQRYFPVSNINKCPGTRSYNDGRAICQSGPIDACDQSRPGRVEFHARQRRGTRHCPAPWLGRIGPPRAVGLPDNWCERLDYRCRSFRNDGHRPRQRGCHGKCELWRCQGAVPLSEPAFEVCQGDPEQSGSPFLRHREFETQKKIPLTGRCSKGRRERNFGGRTYPISVKSMPLGTTTIPESETVNSRLSCSSSYPILKCSGMITSLSTMQRFSWA